MWYSILPVVTEPPPVQCYYIILLITALWLEDYRHMTYNNTHIHLLGWYLLPIYHRIFQYTIESKNDCRLQIDFFAEKV